MWTVFWWLSFGALVVAFLLAIVTACCKLRGVKSIYVLFAGVFVSAFLLIYPIFSETFNGDVGATFKALMIAAQNTIRLFTADNDYTLFQGDATVQPQWIANAYGLLGSLLIILAPLLTFGFVLSFFKGITAWARCTLHLPTDTYVFSNVTAKAVSLAESIRQKDRRALIVFADALKNEDAADDDLLIRLSRIHAVLCSKDISLVRLARSAASKQTAFFAMSEDESENEIEALQLIARYRQRKNTTIFVFSSNVESELMLNNVDKGRLKVRRINPVNAIINHILYQKGGELFDSAVESAHGNKAISALVVGVDKLGTEMLRSLAWYGQMDGYTLTIHGFDRDADVKDRVSALCPELIDERYNGVEREGEAYYRIEFHTADVNSASFREEIRRIGTVTYAFVSLGEDSLNVTTAVNLRILFEQMHIHPKIVAVVSNHEKNAALAGAKDRNGTLYDIDFVGDTHTVYSHEVLLHSALEQEALALHKRYNGGDAYGFYEFEYNYQSSLASVIHYAARCHCGISGADKPAAELTPAQRDVIELIEHKRWNAYMRSQGYIYSGSKEKESRNDLGKMHHNLVEFALLTEEDKRKDSRVGTT